MDPKQREIVQRLVEDGLVRPPSSYRAGQIQIKVDNSIPNNVWIMNDSTRTEFLKFIWHQQTIAERMKRRRLVEFERDRQRRMRSENVPPR